MVCMVTVNILRLISLRAIIVLEGIVSSIKSLKISFSWLGALTPDIQIMTSIKLILQSYYGKSI